MSNWSCRIRPTSASSTRSPNAWDLPTEKVFINLDRYGNTSAASVPIALDEAWEAGRFGDNDLVLLNACGGGLTWGASLLRW